MTGEPTPPSAALDGIGRALGPALGPEGLFRAIARGIRRAVPCERCLIASVDPGTKRRILNHEAIIQGTPILIEDARTDPRYPFPPKTAAAEGFASLLVVPLIHKGAAFGSLTYYWNAPRALAPSDVALAEAFASQAASAGSPG